MPNLKVGDPVKIVDLDVKANHPGIVGRTTKVKTANGTSSFGYFYQVEDDGNKNFWYRENDLELIEQKEDDEPLPVGTKVRVMGISGLNPEESLRIIGQIGTIEEVMEPGKQYVAKVNGEKYWFERHELEKLYTTTGTFEELPEHLKRAVEDIFE